MKTLVTKVEVEERNDQPAIRLEGERCTLTIHNPPLEAFFGLMEVVYDDSNEAQKRGVPGTQDTRLGLKPILQLLLKACHVTEAYLKREAGQLVGELTWNGGVKKVDPAVAVFIAKAANAPLYFDSDASGGETNPMVV
jgi:hypothetical protein